ncbi:transposase [Tritonibacter mobilis]
MIIKIPFGIPLRRTAGFVQSLLRMVGLDWSTLYRR